MKNQVDLKEAAIFALQNCLSQVPFLKIEKILFEGLSGQANLQVWVQIQDSSHLLIIEMKNNGQPRMARLVAYQLKDQLSTAPGAFGIFFAPFISLEAGKICEDMGIGYLDLAGNCLISFEKIYIHQTGAKNPNTQKRELRSLYSSKGERILRTLIDHPKRSWKMAELAQTAGVSLGQVANIKKLLLDREWLRESMDGMSCANPAALLNEWAGAYRFQRNLSTECFALAEIPEIEERLATACQHFGLTYALTNFSSAARIAPMVRYQKVSAYVKGDLKALIEFLDWKIVPSGANVSLLSPYDDGVFLDSREVAEIRIASPVQTFLDLQSVRGRGQEAGEALRKEMEKTW